jgi:hypothetical protein
MGSDLTYIISIFSTLSLKISGADMQMMEAILKDPNGLPVLLEFVAGSPEESVRYILSVTIFGNISLTELFS